MKHKTVVFLALLVGGCHFNVAASSTDIGTSGGGDMSGGGGGGGGGGASMDMAEPPDDLTMICTPGAKSCSGSTLSTCNVAGTGTHTSTCALGCNQSGSDCLQLYPAAPAMPSDFGYGGLSAPTIVAAQTRLVFDTTSGAIIDDSGGTVRMANPSPVSGAVENGIGFRRANGVAIWTFAQLTLPSTTTIVFKGGYGASLLAVGDMSIAGTIDARGYGDPATASTLCANGAGGPGAVTSGSGTGGNGSSAVGGGAGGTYGGKGGVGGGDNNSTGGGTAANSYGSPTLNPLLGGSPGGNGGGGDKGGGGGGVVQLAAQGTITISGLINAGGCGGGAGSATKGGGGGGSGGGIIAEAPTVHLTATANLAANGGGGGGPNGGTPGQPPTPPGQSQTAQALGGAGGGNQDGAGGNGSIAGTPTGANGNDAQNQNGNGGGGGGGAGYIRLNSKPSMLMIDAGAKRSPSTADMLATSGTVDIH